MEPGPFQACKLGPVVREDVSLPTHSLIAP